MNNYCGFIEVWNNGKETLMDDRPLKINSMEHMIEATFLAKWKTIAVFKIKLK